MPVQGPDGEAEAVAAGKVAKYRTVRVGVSMLENTKKKKVKVKVGTKKISKTVGIFNRDVTEVEIDVFEDRTEWVGTGTYSDLHIDGVKFSKDIQAACNRMSREGYELMSTSDIISGRYNFQTGSTGIHPYAIGYSYGYGYSVTDGIVLIFKKTEEVGVHNAK